MFLLNILEAVLAYELVKIRYIKEKEVILNGNTNDKSRGIQLIGPGYLQKVMKGVNWLLSPIGWMLTGVSKIRRVHQNSMFREAWLKIASRAFLDLIVKRSAMATRV